MLKISLRFLIVYKGIDFGRWVEVIHIGAFHLCKTNRIKAMQHSFGRVKYGGQFRLSWLNMFLGRNSADFQHFTFLCPCTWTGPGMHDYTWLDRPQVDERSGNYNLTEWAIQYDLKL